MNYLEAHGKRFIQLLSVGRGNDVLTECMTLGLSPVQGVHIDRVRRIDQSLPSVLIIAMKRSGSTFITKSLVDSAGYIDVPYAVAGRGDALLTAQAGWMAVNGFALRIHSAPTDQVLSCVRRLAPKHVVFLHRNPVDAAFSLFVRRFYNPRAADIERGCVIAIPEDQAVDRNVFNAFMADAISDNTAFVKRWKEGLGKLGRPVIVLRYDDFYRDEAASLGDLSKILNLDGPLTPAAKDTDANWQRPLSDRLRERFAEWISELSPGLSA